MGVVLVAVVNGHVDVEPAVPEEAALMDVSGVTADLIPPKIRSGPDQIC